MGRCPECRADPAGIDAASETSDQPEANPEGASDATADLAATAIQTASLGDDVRGARLVTTQAVTGNYFELLGLVPEVGRLIQPYDDEYGSGVAVAVLSEALWRDHFAA